ncbi:uncharacterized protein LOC107806759 isoform X2 [Nicotiana tabacum]|uniref:Uncharacterized protein LOC107806759 isoform X2 n=1 Tax=Nicotiana tabacum TaxID=4097 RepID=A0AC58UU94_TOBAC
MDDSVTISLLSTVQVPNPVLSTKSGESQHKYNVLFRGNQCSISLKIGTKCSGMRSSTRLYAGLTEIEPDINEDPVDRWRTNGIEIEDFVFGKYDDHHTYFESEDKAIAAPPIPPTTTDSSSSTAGDLHSQGGFYRRG